MTATDADVVPLRKQYLQIKARFPDTILFFRLGDFYENRKGSGKARPVPPPQSGQPRSAASNQTRP